MKSKEIFELIKDDPKKYNAFFDEIDEYASEDMIEGFNEILVGYHFTAETLTEALAGMENKDGTIGGHWTLEQTNDVALQVGFDYKALGYNDYDWNYSLNMIYSDYYEPEKTIETYIKDSINFLTDKDTSKGERAYKYYLFMVKEEFPC